MLLIITNSQDVTADYLATVLTARHIVFVRLDTDTLLNRVSFTFERGKPLLRVDSHWYSPAEFSNVWYRRPERLKHHDFETTPEEKITLEEWAETLEGFFAHIPADKWMNHPAFNVAASHKIEQLTRATTLGLTTPDTLVTQDAARLRAFFSQHKGKVIVKPLASGYVERPEGQSDTLIYTNEVAGSHLDDLADLQACPTLFQQRIDKSCDVRITVVDGEIHAVDLIAAEEGGAQRCDIRRNNMEDVSYRKRVLPDAVLEKLKTLLNSYRLRFAAIDMAVDTEGQWVFFEINPNGQWAWLDLDAGLDIASSFVRVFANGR